MIKISESLIQFEEEPLEMTEKVVLESADRILQQYRFSYEKQKHHASSQETIESYGFEETFAAENPSSEAVPDPYGLKKQF